MFSGYAKVGPSSGLQIGRNFKLFSLASYKEWEEVKCPDFKNKSRGKWHGMNEGVQGHMCRAQARTWKSGVTMTCLRQTFETHMGWLPILFSLASSTPSSPGMSAMCQRQISVAFLLTDSLPLGRHERQHGHIHSAYCLDCPQLSLARSIYPICTTDVLSLVISSVNCSTPFKILL